MGMHHKLRVMMMHTQTEYNNLEGPLTGKPLFKMQLDDMRRMGDTGIDALVRNSKAAPLTYQMIESCCKIFDRTNVMLLPGTYKEKMIFERETKNVLPKMFEYLKEHVDVVMIDVNAGNSEFSEYILKHADLIVVNLSQNMAVTNRFFEMQDNIISQKNVFYLFGLYDEDSKYNLSNIQKKSKFIKKKNSGTIPYCTKFRDAQSDGYVIEFMEEILKLPTKSMMEEYDYIHKSKLATEKILDMLKISVRAEDREGRM